MRWTAALLLAANAHVAAAAPGVDKPTAEKLFDEGRAELQAGHPDAACSKFEQSIEKDPRAVGTLLNLGLCNERQGKVASALALFIEAYDRANEANDQQLRSAAQEHVTELRPQVPIVAIKYAAPPVAGEKLVLDDRVITREKHELPVDPGIHAVVYTAPGRLPYETSLVVKVASRVPLQLPALAVPSETNPRRLAGEVTTIAGAALVVASLAMGAYAYHEYHAQFGASGHCGVFPPIDGDPVCDRTGQNAVTASRRWATAATISGAAGIVVAGVGITLWWTAPSDAHVAPVGVAIAGRF